MFRPREPRIPVGRQFAGTLSALPRLSQPRAFMYLIWMALYAAEVRTPTLVLKQIWRASPDRHEASPRTQAARKLNLPCVVQTLFSQFPSA